MRIEQIKQFIEVAASESINATAQQRYISQQGLSDSLKRMEQELGIALLKKDKTGAFIFNTGRQRPSGIFPRHCRQLPKN